MRWISLSSWGGGRGQAGVRHPWNEERKGRCQSKLNWGAQHNLSCQRSSVHPELTPSTCFGGGNLIFSVFFLREESLHVFWPSHWEQPPLVHGHTKGFLWRLGWGDRRRDRDTGEWAPSPQSRLPRCSCSEGNEPPEREGIKSLKGLNFHSSCSSNPPPRQEGHGDATIPSPSGCGSPSRHSSPAPAAASRSPAGAARSPAGRRLPGPSGCQLTRPGHSPGPPHQPGPEHPDTAAGTRLAPGRAAPCREPGERVKVWQGWPQLQHPIEHVLVPPQRRWKCLSCFLELGSAWSLTTNPVLQACFDLTPPGPGQWVWMGCQPPKPFSSWECCRQPGSGCTLEARIFLIFWAPHWSFLTAKL